MKRKYTAAIIAAMLSITSLSLAACSASGANASSASANSASASVISQSAETGSAGTENSGNELADSASSGDSSSSTGSTVSAVSALVSSETSSAATASSNGASSSASAESNASDGELTSAAAVADDDMFKNKDADTSWSDEVTITLKDGASEADGTGVSIDGDVITITEPGTYLLTGTLTDGQIVVDSDEEDTVHIILDNVSITNSSSAAIYSLATDKLIITTAEGSENYLSTTGEYVQTDDNSVDAVIFAKTDLSLNGEGTLSISAPYGHAIVSKDDLVITSGSYTLDAAKCGLSGKDSIRIAGGSFNIAAGTDALHSDNTEDEDKGFIYIIGGTYQISCSDDAIHTSGDLTIKDGEFNITDSYEGLEGLTINIAGGTFDIISSDDAVNAAGGNDGSGYGTGGDMFAVNTDAYVNITGGDISINSGGDSLDSNGSLYISGGTITLNGPENNGNGILDYNGEGVITGGTLIASSSSGMAMNFQSSSTQCSILQNLTSSYNGGTEITLTDSEGNVIVQTTSEKQFSSVLISSPELATGKAYALTVGSDQYSIELTETIYGSGTGMGMGGMQGAGMQGGGMPGGMQGGMGRMQ